VSCLIEVHRAAPPARALYEAARRCGRCDSVCLLYTAASGRPAELEAGKRLLLDSVRALHRLDRRLVVDARLEIGDKAERLLHVAEEIRPELIVISAHGEGEFPRLEAVGRTARTVLEWGCLPVLLVSPKGQELCDPHRHRARACPAAIPSPRRSRRLAPGSLQTPSASL